MAKAKDRFDRLPKERGRIGAHRGAIRRGGGWLGFLLIVIGVVVLTAAGFLVATNVFKIKLDFDFPFLDRLIPTATPSVTPTPPPPTAAPTDAVARGLTIIVLNGTPVDGLQDQVSAGLAAAGWPMSTAALASSQNIEDTVVYYTDTTNADVARGIVQTLGFGKVRPVSPDVYPGVSIVVVIGMDDPAVPQPTPTAS